MINNQASIEQEKSIGFLLYRTSLAMRQLLQKEIKDNGFDITAEQWAILNNLWIQDGISQNDIAIKLCKQRPNITRIIDELEKNNLVSRKSNTNDRRKYQIFLTTQGKDVVKNLKSIVKNIQQKVCEGLSEEEINNIIDSLNKIYKNVNTHINNL